MTEFSNNFHAVIVLSSDSSLTQNYLIYLNIPNHNIIIKATLNFDNFEMFQLFDNFKLNGMILHVVASYKYLGHYITDDLSDDDDINRQRRTLFVQGNIILQKFNMCSLSVKLTLFRTYCSPMYTAQLYNHLPLQNYKFLIITFLKCFLACPNMKALVTYAHFLTFNAANL